MAGYKRPELKLGDVWEYNYSSLKKFSDSELRKEYSRLRSIAQKRIKRLGESQWSWTNTYQTYKEGFPELSEIKTHSDLVKELQTLGHYVYSKETSISGMNEIMKKSIESLNESGYDFVNERNWRAWTQFMDKYKKLWSKGSPTPEMLMLREDFEASKNDPDALAELFDTWAEEIDYM